MAGTPDARARRVVVKVRLVNLRKTSAATNHHHLQYIVRDGVTPDGGPGQAYGATVDPADVDAFEARGREDRHQFRLIVAGEDGVELGDLKAFTRQLMGRVEQDLGTRLEWVAVDHWDTDNPHTHIVLRGKDQAGADLVIARDYIAHGLRTRASALATEWLGPRNELDLRQAQRREVEQERWTGLDRTLQRLAVDGVVNLQALPADENGRSQRAVLAGRLRRLADFDLAVQSDSGTWQLRSDAEPVLRSMGERRDIIRTMQRAMGDGLRQPALFDPATALGPLIGRIAATGMAGEEHDRGYLVVDGIDGRTHYATLATGIALADLPVGGIVEVRRVAPVRRADQAIAALARQEIYRPAEHLVHARADAQRDQDPEAFVAAHVRRLEALRRAGIVERLQEGVWRVPADLPEQGRRYDRKRLTGASVELRSHLAVERQVRALGATWLDRELLNGATGVGSVGFGASVRTALTERTEFLVEHQLAERRGARLILARDLLATLRTRELAATGERIAGETGLTHRPLVDGQRVAGTYRRAVWLASGRFAMLEDGQAFSLVPWRPVLERRLGQSVSAVVHGDRVTWEFGRSRGLSR
jgi:type IV secretory pathway VirD2 relaxase